MKVGLVGLPRSGKMSFYALIRGGLGATAQVAAGRIHSDLRCGPVRAKDMSIDDLIAAEIWDAAKAGGKMRLEEKITRSKTAMFCTCGPRCNDASI